jgi:hypothetical protein
MRFSHVAVTTDEVTWMELACIASRVTPREEVSANLGACEIGKIYAWHR